MTIEQAYGNEYLLLGRSILFLREYLHGLEKSMKSRVPDFLLMIIFSVVNVNRISSNFLYIVSDANGMSGVIFMTIRKF